MKRLPDKNHVRPIASDLDRDHLVAMTALPAKTLTKGAEITRQEDHHEIYPHLDLLHVSENVPVLHRESVQLNGWQLVRDRHSGRKS